MKSETKYRIIADGTYDFEFWINPQGQFVYASPSTKRITGHDAKDFIEDPDLRTRLVHPDDRSILDRHIKDDEKKHKASEVEYRLIHADGSIRWISHACQPVFSDKGKYLGVRGSNRDITERKQMVEELRRSRDELEMRVQERTAELRSASLYARSLIEAGLDPLVTIGSDGKIMDVNIATELATGLSRDALIGSDFSDYFTEPEKAREGYKEVFSKGFVRDYPLAIRHTSSRVTEVLYNATVYKNEAGEIQGVFAAARDITERKQAEEALRKAHDQVRFFASQCLTAQERERRLIAGEIHDSLGASLAATKFKVESVLNEMGDGNPQVKVALDSVLPVLQGTIEEARRIQMSLRPSMLDDLGILATMNWFCRQFETTYSHIHIRQEINIEESEVPDFLKTVIYRVLQEAMNNIAKHSKADRINLLLRKMDGAIELGIQDNGEGFDPEKALARVGTNRGLGLSSMRERAELSGGSFSIESGKGRGTVIRATWLVNS